MGSAFREQFSFQDCNRMQVRVTQKGGSHLELWTLPGLGGSFPGGGGLAPSLNCFLLVYGQTGQLFFKADRILSLKQPALAGPTMYYAMRWTFYIHCF